MAWSYTDGMVGINASASALVPPAADFTSFSASANPVLMGYVIQQQNFASASANASAIHYAFRQTATTGASANLPALSPGDTIVEKNQAIEGKPTGPSNVDPIYFYNNTSASAWMTYAAKWWVR